MFALQDENKAMGRVPHRDRVTNNITPKRVMERRQNVRNYRENQQIAAGIFQENKKIAAEQAAEESRKQQMYDEDMRQGGMLGIIRDKLGQEAAARNNKALDARAALDRESRLEAARITAGGRGSNDPDSRLKTALEGDFGILEQIADPDERKSHLDMMKRKMMGFSANDTGEPLLPPQTFEEQRAAKAKAGAEKKAKAKATPRDSALSLVSSIDSGNMSEQQARQQAILHGMETTSELERLLSQRVAATQNGGFAPPNDWSFGGM